MAFLNRSTLEGNHETYESVAREYLTGELHPPEQRLLSRFKNRWHQMAVLDLGVGAGRTALTFAPLVKRYVGVDYSKEMIALSRSKVEENDSINFVVCDATDLSNLYVERFDLILFSFNGIDYVGPEKRVRILREVRKLLRDDSSCFFFSTHCLHVFPFRNQLPPPDLKRPVRWAYSCASQALRNAKLSWINRKTAPEEVKSRGWAILNDGVHNFQIATHYVTPEYQLAQLKQEGFRVLEMYREDGVSLTDCSKFSGPWMSFLCSASDPSTASAK